jgi:hypothetical protein
LPAKTNGSIDPSFMEELLSITRLLDNQPALMDAARVEKVTERRSLAAKEPAREYRCPRAG